MYALHTDISPRLIDRYMVQGRQLRADAMAAGYRAARAFLKRLVTGRPAADGSLSLG
ncbi:RSP_7527 family protein [Oceanibaculum pacificum]|uniref:RSP_7527 family protein n=1 Tax=Oceanibaculum pacificum TaxID=580166 RepID=UPI0012EED932|nr:hypothetical protein [Oceanibaculum pacificum]